MLVVVKDYKRSFLLWTGGGQPTNRRTAGRGVDGWMTMPLTLVSVTQAAVRKIPLPDLCILHRK